jgi:hypothetical protein
MNIDDAMEAVTKSICNGDKMIPVEIALILHDNIQDLRLCLEGKNKKCDLCYTCNYDEGCEGYYYTQKHIFYEKQN